MCQFCSLCRKVACRGGLFMISEGGGVQLSRVEYGGFIGNHIQRLLDKSRRVLGTSGWSWPSQMSSHTFVHLPGKESLQSQSKKGVLRGLLTLGSMNSAGLSTILRNFQCLTSRPDPPESPVCQGTSCVQEGTGSRTSCVRSRVS